MSRVAYALAWALSLLSLSLPLARHVDGETLSRALLAAIPWIAVAGLPEARKDAGRPWAGLAAALPLLAVGLALDATSRVEPALLIRWGIFVPATWTALVLSRAPGERDGVAGGILWLAYLVLPCALLSLPEGTVGSGEGPAWWQSATPLGWLIAEWLVGPRGATWEPGRDLALAGSLIAFTVVRRRLGRSEETS